MARHLEMLSDPGSRYPRWTMGREHLLGVWHVAPTLPAKVLLTTKAARWYWGRWHDYLLEERRAAKLSLAPQ